jgi:antitoxin component YwqK of YwqJK toxin-antitoxin module
MRRSIFLTVLLLFISSGLCFAKVVKEYFPDGRVYYIQKYDANDNIVGPFKRYWPNGRLREKIIYKNGVPYLTYRWSQEGVRLETITH